MNDSNRTIRIYYLPQSFPCGPQSSCCGPVGQSEDELREYVTQLEKALPGLEIEKVDVSQKLNMKRDEPVIKLLNTFGAAACPIFAFAGEVLSMGPPLIPELVDLVKAKLEAQTSAVEQPSK